MVNDIIIGDKYFNLEIDSRFPLILPDSDYWQDFIQKGFNRPKNCFIYLIKCFEHLYVGSDKNGKRITYHASRLRHKSHPNNFMQNAFNKHGKDNFYYYPLIEIPPEFIQYRDQIENSYIKLFDTFHGRNNLGFNLAEFADIPMLGRVFSEEHRAKISNAHKGKKHSEEHSKNFANAIAKDYTFFNPDGEQVKIHNLTQFCKEKGLHVGAMINLSQGLSFHHKQWTHVNSKIKKEHSLIDPNGEIHNFNHMDNFCKEYELSISVISQVLSNKQLQHKGWKKNNNQND